jgi:hypothetical protein
MTDACPKCGEPGGAKYTHRCSPRAAVRKYAHGLPDTRHSLEVERRAGLAFRLLICDRCRAVWPTERDEAHGGARLDGDPCSYTAFGSKPCRGRVWPMNFTHADHGAHEPPRQDGEWRVGDNAWREALGLPLGCRDIALVRKTYRRLAKELHPDVAGGDTAKMAKVNEAYAQALAELGQPTS